ncbi:helicase-associated domain-containing protein [Sciscionella marina]|uniref:helicase-associated domain-containing protein n=1 Tax=Sciscionella marina TaxID=508770 RepID=UPI000371B3A6|nr:helicase-associated domain-containing protein [Sciscionella marina]
MENGSFAGYLAGLDETKLIQLLRMRADVRVEPVPTSFTQLAERLAGADSLSFGLREVNRDCVVVGQAIAALGASAGIPEMARLLGIPEPGLRDPVADLCGRGLAWTDSDTVRLPDRLAAHWSAELGGGRPIARVARDVLVDDLRAAAEALGADVTGLRKPELTVRLEQTLADVPAVAQIVAKLPSAARDQLDELRCDAGAGHVYYGAPRTSPNRQLAASGLILRVGSRWELPREVGLAAWLAELEEPLIGPPDIPAAEPAPAQVLTTAQAAVQDLVGAVTAVLDEAGSTPISALKKGGVGSRERSRLAARLALPAEVVPLAIDLASAASLLGPVSGGYAPTDSYPHWRQAEPGHQWAALVTAWFALEHAPTSRDIQDDKELPPPLPLVSDAGMIRRALLRAARGGRAVTAASEHIDWFCPLHAYEPGQLREKLAAAVREGRRLGLLAADVLSDHGEHLISAHDEDDGDTVSELAERVAPLFPDARCAVVLQSDLTAVVSGQPGPAAARLLAASAVCETRGTASVWRFSPESIRDALDAGWTSEGLLAELAALSDRALPQPLEYLITDVDRRHGQVRVRGMRSCVLADAGTVAEILHTRELAGLQLAQLASTVLSSPLDPDEVLTKLRSAGFAPVAEDAQGAVIVEHRHQHRARTKTETTPRATRTRLCAGDLAGRLLADPNGETTAETEVSDTFERLTTLRTSLTEAELVLLADALEHQRDVLISYRDKNGSWTHRDIRPRELYGRWLVSWCHLRNGEREFTVANIESVAPA